MKIEIADCSANISILPKDNIQLSDVTFDFLLSNYQTLSITIYSTNTQYGYYISDYSHDDSINTCLSDLLNSIIITDEK